MDLLNEIQSVIWTHIAAAARTVTFQVTRQWNSSYYVYNGYKKYSILKNLLIGIINESKQDLISKLAYSIRYRVLCGLT